MIQTLQLLTELGYTAAPQHRSFGGPFCLISPMDVIVWEGSFEDELTSVLEK